VIMSMLCTVGESEGLEAGPKSGNGRRGYCISALVLAVALLGGSRAAPAAIVYLPDLPDFYQHQLSGSDAGNMYNIPANFAGYTDPLAPSYSLTQPVNTGGPGVQWERDGGWCLIAGYTDAFYQLDLHGASGVFNHGGVHTWLERMAFGISDLAIDTFGFGGAPKLTIDQFMAFYVGANKVEHDIYTWNAAAGRVRLNGVNTAYTSMDALYQDQIAAGHDAVMNIVNPAGNNPAWWWTAAAGEAPKAGHFHTLAGAGFDAASSTIYYADPNDQGNGAATADWGFPYANAAALPVGAGFYGSNTMAADGTLGGAGGYSGALVNQIDVLFVPGAPEPSSIISLAVGFGVLALVRRLNKTSARA
jgi:hypothetical protein